MQEFEMSPENQRKIIKFGFLMSRAKHGALDKDEIDWLMATWSEGQGALNVVHGMIAESEAREAMNKAKE